MSYGLKYYARIADSSGNTYTLNLKKLDFIGSATEITHYAHSSPLRLQYRGGKDEQTIYPSSITFDLFRKNTDDFNDLLVSQFRDYQIEIIKNDSTTFWKGFLQPEGINTKFVADEYFISITCADGLLDLKSIQYPSTYVSGNTRIIEIVRNCLSQTGINLPIIDQVNISEAHSTEPVLASIFANSNRFIDNKDGRTKYLNCFDTVSRLLDSFNCQLSQSKGYWVITQRNEVNSKRHTYNSVALTATTTLYNRTIDISNYAYSYDSDQLSKVVPYGEVGINFQNRNISSNILPNSTFDEDINGWSNGSASPFYSVAQYFGRLQTRDVAGFSDPNTPHEFVSTTFPLQTIGTGNTITLSADIQADPTWSGSTVDQTYPYVRFDLIYPDASSELGTLQRLDGTIKRYSDTFDLNQDGDYQIRVWVITDYPTAINTQLDTYFDNFTAIPSYSDADITFDKYSSGLNTGSTAVQKGDRTIFFADSSNTGDLGALMYSPTGFTSSWSNYDGSLSDVPLTQLLAYNILRSRSRFKNYLRITLITDSTIDFNSIVNVGGTKYSIVGMSHDLKTLFCELELVEFLEDGVSMSFNEFTLNTVDGQSAAGSSTSTGSLSEAQFNSFASDTNATLNEHETAIATLQSTTLQDVTENGNSTTQGIVLKNSDSSKSWRVSVDESTGHLIMSGGSNQNLHVSGDVIAFSSSTPPAANWWSTAPLGTGLAFTGGTINVTGGTGGGSIGAIGTINAVTKSSNGAVITGSTLFMQTADASYPGLVSTGTQAFGGNKTFNGTIDAESFVRIKSGGNNIGLMGVGSSVGGNANDFDLYTYGTNFNIWTGGVLNFKMNSSGNVGIGVNPAEKLHVFRGSSYGNIVQFEGGTSSYSSILSHDGSNATWSTNSARGIVFAPNSTGALYIANGGKVGVGAAPSNELHVTKNQNATTVIKVSNSDSTNGLSRAQVSAVCGAVESQLVSIGNSSNPEVYMGAATSHKLNLMTGGSSRLVIDTSGNVGIGTTTPHAPLQFSNGGTEQRKIVLYESGDNNNQYYGFGIGADTLQYKVGTTSGNHVFYAAADTATSNELMRLTGTGKLGIGTSSVDHTLVLNDTTGGGSLLKMVRGTGFVRFLMDNNSSKLYLRATDNLILNDTGGKVGIGANPSFPLDIYSSVNAPTINIRTDQNFQAGIRISRTVNTPTTWEMYAPVGSTDIRLYNAGDRFTFTSGGNFTATGEITAYSDRRLKDNIETYNKGLDSVLALQPVQYNMKGNNTKKQIGVIAQDVQQVEPLLVEDNNGTLSVNYQKIAVMLVNAVKELNTTVETLKQEIEQLKNASAGKEENNTKKTRKKKS